MIIRRSHGRQILKGSSAGDHGAKTFFNDLLTPHHKTQQNDKISKREVWKIYELKCSTNIRKQNRAKEYSNGETWMPKFASLDFGTCSQNLLDYSSCSSASRNSTLKPSLAIKRLLRAKTIEVAGRTRIHCGMP